MELSKINLEELKNKSCLDCKYSGNCNCIHIEGLQKTLEDICALEKSGYDYFKE